MIVTVGAGGAFPSGTAKLTPQAKKIMDNIAKVIQKVKVLSWLQVMQMMCH